MTDTAIHHHSHAHSHAAAPHVVHHGHGHPVTVSPTPVLMSSFTSSATPSSLQPSAAFVAAALAPWPAQTGPVLSRSSPLPAAHAATSVSSSSSLSASSPPLVLATPVAVQSTSSPAAPTSSLTSSTGATATPATATTTTTTTPPGEEKKEQSEIFASVKLSQFHKHVESQKTMIDGAFDAFDIEMEVLLQMSQQPQMLKRVYQLPAAARPKNRYHNVLPNTHSRVILSGRDDYINATLLKPREERLFAGARCDYVAASAPIEATFGDWWRMCWELNSNIVIMLTREKERDRYNQLQKKADVYWPSDGKSESYDDIVVTCTEATRKVGDTTVRKFTMTKGSETRPMLHLQYTGWPDHGVPTPDASGEGGYGAFVQMFDMYRKARTECKGPIITHCSAGIGRTGTFIGLDIILDCISVERRTAEGGVADPLINVFSVVKFMRDQRAGMVQSKQQYAFISFFLDYCIQNKLLGV